MMGLTRKLFNLLIRDMDTDPMMQQKALKLFEELKVKLWEPKKSGKKEKTVTLSQQVKKSSFQRTQLITLLENWEKFHKILEEHSKLDTEKVKNLISYFF